MHKMLEFDVAAPERDFAGLCHEGGAERPIDRVLDAALQKQQVGSAEAIILKAGKRQFAIDVRAAQRRLKIKRHYVSRGSKGLRDQQPQSYTAFAIAGDRWAVRCGRGRTRRTVVRPIVVARQEGSRLFIERDLMRQINGKPPE